MRALDLFCGAGGATAGLQRAGFHVTGVDVVRSPRYCGDAFVEADALEVDLAGYDFIWASPVCKRYCIFARNLGTSERHPDQVGAIRERLRACGTPWAIENVPGSPLKPTVELCGTMFGLRLLRHRLFELSFAVGLVPPCQHRGDEIPVYGNGTPKWHRDRLGRSGSYSRATRSGCSRKALVPMAEAKCIKRILWFDDYQILMCDGRCDKAWGISDRPRVNFDPNEPDDYALFTDDELGTAPADPGTYEGRHGKPSAAPLTDSSLMNKWCARACERSRMVPAGSPDRRVPQFKTRVHNMPWLHPEDADGE